MINVIGMKSESEMPEAYKDFIREEGAPSILRRDNSQVQSGVRTTQVNREFFIKDEFTEPGHPQQNPAELRAVKFLKDHTQVPLDRTGAPEDLWLLACEYIADVHNVCADESINYQIPRELRHGGLQDISAFLEYRFYEPILYLDSDSSFPSTKEHVGWWVGVASNVGDALTYKVLTDDTRKVIHRSVLRPATDDRFRNKRVRFEPPPDEGAPSTGEGRGRRQLKVDMGLSQRKNKKQIRRQLRRPCSASPDKGGRPNATTTRVYDTEYADDSLEPPPDGEPSNTGNDGGTIGPTTDGIDRGDTVLKEESTTPAPRRSGRTRPSRTCLHSKRSSPLKSIIGSFLLGFTFGSNYDQASPQHPHPETTNGTYPDLHSNPRQFQLDTLTPGETASLRNLLTMDNLLDSQDPEPDAHSWKCLAVTKHKLRTLDPTDVHVKVKAIWGDGEASWVRADALRLQDPYPLVTYAVKQRITKDTG